MWYEFINFSLIQCHVDHLYGNSIQVGGLIDLPFEIKLPTSIAYIVTYIFCGLWWNEWSAIKYQISGYKCLPLDLITKRSTMYYMILRWINFMWQVLNKLT